MCTVKYGPCPDGVDCSGTTPVTGVIHLELPLIVEVDSSGLVVREGSEVIVLTCEVYGYPRDSSPPMWSSPGRNLESGRFNITPRYTGTLSNGSVSSSDKVALSQLTIFNITVADEGEYKCSVDGESASFRVDLGGSNSSGSNSGVIAGVLITLLLLIALIIILIFVFWVVCYRRRGKLDLGSCRELSCGSCSCVPLLAALKGVKLPTRHRENLDKNGTRLRLNERNHIADTNTEIYSVVQKPLKKISKSPPPLPPLTLTETELNELTSIDEKEELSPIQEKPTRRNTGLSTYSQSGTIPKLAKLTKLRKFKMKENPIYQSADELELELELQVDNTLYALPSKPNSTRNSASFTDDLASDPIYSVAINPSMFTKRSSTIGNDDDLHPYGPIYARPIKQKMRQPLNVSVDNIREVKQIGVGQFGAVVLAEMTGLSGSNVASLPKGSMNADGVALVAVKKLKPDVSDEVLQSFDKEIKFMSQLQHDSIVQLLAICTHSKHPFIVMEYMENGDLNQFLQKYQMVDDDSALYSNQIPPSTLLYMAVQIASGMVYLSSLNYVHRDLATRNCLVGSNFRIKISDFGMKRNLYERVYYRVRGRAMLPIRWMATESFYGRFSEKSDAWAYGVTVWEIYTLGKKQPYEELDDQDMIQDAIRGTGRRIMGRPRGVAGCVRGATRCWVYAAADRATFKEIHDSLNLIQLNS
uniref:receptor protein-tyrosine kinase n=2 Tax=Geodia cydonium TaxID=6047 RepID=Q27656_GEOCY|nr:Sponge receptor tyrosine kinase [Geodia cydonium]